MNKPALHNDVGGKQYPPDVQALLYSIALELKRRDRDHVPDYDTENGCRPRDYMPMYVKAAAVVFETACALARMNEMSKAKSKSIVEWIRVITGILRIPVIDESLLLGKANEQRTLDAGRTGEVCERRGDAQPETGLHGLGGECEDGGDSSLPRGDVG